MKTLQKIILLIIILNLLSGCTINKIEGIVTDCTGKPLENVAIKVENSRYKVMTNKQGEYEIDYTPGAFSVFFSKEGFLNQKMELNLCKKNHFPAEDIVMNTKSKLFVETTPENATVSLLGISSPYDELPLQPGFYQILVEAQGYQSEVKEIFIKPCENPTITVELSIKPPKTVDINGKFNSNDEVGDIFIITGKVVNANYQSIMIKGVLLNSKKKVVKEAVSQFGNVLSDDELIKLKFSEIEARLLSTEKKHEPNGIIPFMIVLKDIPEDLSEFTVNVIEFK